MLKCRVNRAHRAGRPEPGVDGDAAAGAERAVVRLTDVGPQRRNLLEQLVLRQVAALLPCQVVWQSISTVDDIVQSLPVRLHAGMCPNSSCCAR